MGYFNELVYTVSARVISFEKGKNLYFEAAIDPFVFLLSFNCKNITLIRHICVAFVIILKLRFVRKMDDSPVIAVQVSSTDSSLVVYSMFSSENH